MVQNITSLDEGDVSEAELLHLLLLCFWYFALFAQSHGPKVCGRCKFAHRMA
jgi:hypothetical protein